jgi:hypothetical protein
MKNEIGRLSVDTLSVFDDLKNKVNWFDMVVGRGGRSCKRKAQEWSYYNGFLPVTYVPSEYAFLEPVVFEMMGIVASLCPANEIMMPIQMFLNYYPDGGNNCPMHRHGCRQITVSIGSDRLFKINSKTYTLTCGNYVVLYNQLHGVPKQENVGERMSLNLFYCHSGDTDVAVTVNKTAKRSR